jgi:hypothetical protein
VFQRINNDDDDDNNNNNKPYNVNSAHVEYDSESDTSNNRGDWNHLDITQTIHEQRTGKARNQAAKKKKLALNI